MQISSPAAACVQGTFVKNLLRPSELHWMKLVFCLLCKLNDKTDVLSKALLADEMACRILFLEEFFTSADKSCVLREKQ